jgi:hypothetical protein
MIPAWSSPLICQNVYAAVSGGSRVVPHQASHARVQYFGYEFGSLQSNVTPAKHFQLLLAMPPSLKQACF